MVEVEERLNDLGIQFRIQGQDYLVKCFSPTHEDSSPSMRIDSLTGIYHCFSCGHKGMLLGADSLKTHQLSRRVTVMKSKISMLNSGYTLMPENAVLFKNDYRGISSKTYEHFRAFTDSTPELVDRIVIPITNISGNIVLFQGRTLHGQVTPKYRFFPRHIDPPLFPAAPELHNNSITLVEGLFDMLNLYDKGITSAVCVFGTSFSRRKDLLERLNNYRLQGVTTINILFDGDRAGYEAASIIEERLESHYNVNVITLPDGTDPGGLTKQEVLKLGIQNKLT